MNQKNQTGSHFIDGSWVASDTGRFATIINPADESSIGDAHLASRNQALGAISAARTAFDHGIWPSLSAKDRRGRIQAFLDALTARRDRIIDLNVAEAGSVRAHAETMHFDLPMSHAQFQADHSEMSVSVAMVPNLVPMGDTVFLGSSVVNRYPIGVVTAITAYNFPFFLNLAKIVPALLVGCTVILKPSPLTPFEALILGEAAQEADLPPGVLNIVNGGKDVGEVLTSDERVDLVTFTGSDAIGSRIMEQAAPTLKRLLLELGGKSALIVRSDADLDLATTIALTSFTLQAGQGCGLLTRHIVHNSVRARFVEELAHKVQSIRVGDPEDSRTGMGPLISAAAVAKTEAYVQGALEDGANLICGGERPANLDRGFYFLPTLFDNVKNASKIAQEEIFGPVAIVIGFDNDTEAIRYANESHYGLSGGIITRDVGTGYKMANALQTGYVNINGGTGTMNSDLPFGGIKRSGFGREFGLDGLLEFTYSKSIAFHAG